MWITNKTEFTFRNNFGHIETVVKKNKKLGGKFAGICDPNTFGFVRWEKKCKELGIKPVFGVSIPVVVHLDKQRYYNVMSFIALNNKGLSELLNLTRVSTEQFFYVPRLTYKQVNAISKNVVVISGVAPKLNHINREFYLQLSPDTPKIMRGIKSVESIACCNNFYPEKKHKRYYEAMADSFVLERKTTPQHILSEKEWLKEFPSREDALHNLKKIGKKAKAQLQKAPMLKYTGKDTIEKRCAKGAKERGFKKLPKKYQKRLEYELQLIKEKNYTDYFMIVSDIVLKAKKKMVVGPSRGSAGGSLVCYLMGITDLDPLKHGLYFERFIDVNRFDYPDIDIDFQFDKRHLVLQDIEKTYGVNNVAQIGNISTLKERSAIIRVSKALSIPAGDTDAIKELSDTNNESLKQILNETELGKAFLTKYPAMDVLEKLEGHALHSSVHAAGVLVCNKPITNYCGINARDKKHVAMLDKDDAEYQNLIKIDILGLKTLSTLAQVCDLAKIPYNTLFKLKFDDKPTFKMLNRGMFSGIFQFEGDAIRKLASEMPIKNIDDISALSAICRPGSLSSGAASRFIRRRAGRERTTYIDKSKPFVAATKETYGTIIYQEQVMQLAKKYAGLNWEQVGNIRRAVAKSKGKKEMNKYKKAFIKGATKKGTKKKLAREVWEHILTFGGYGFNKSHSMGYAYITYCTAYLKANYPLEFTVAALNTIDNDHVALKFLREMVRNFGINYVPFDKKISQEKWTLQVGVAVGGYLSIHGVGAARAKRFVNYFAGNTTKELTASERSIINNAKTPFDHLYPAREIYGKYYQRAYTVAGVHIGPAVQIKEIKKDNREYTFIGMLTKKNIRDMNEVERVLKRGGRVLDPPTTFMTMILEDDTKSIMCAIWADSFEDLGQDIANNGKEEKDWYLISGVYNKEWDSIAVEYIKRITK